MGKESWTSCFVSTLSNWHRWKILFLTQLGQNHTFKEKLVFYVLVIYGIVSFWFSVFNGSVSKEIKGFKPQESTQKQLRLPVCVLSRFSLRLTLCHPMDYSPPGSSVYGILQARMLEWVIIPLQGIFLTQGLNRVSCLLHWQQVLYH